MNFYSNSGYLLPLEQIIAHKSPPSNKLLMVLKQSCRIIRCHYNEFVTILIRKTIYLLFSIIIWEEANIQPIFSSDFLLICDGGTGV
jgi:hypothetical protein